LGFRGEYRLWVIVIAARVMGVMQLTGFWFGIDVGGI
jgi:hypothetical protein